MPLPKNNAVIHYELTLPSNGKKIQYRPFLVGEQKILLMALEGGLDETEVLNALKQIIENCSDGNLPKDEIHSLPIFDLEYFFLKVRSKSVGEIVELRYKCFNKIDDKECGAITKTSVNLDEVPSPVIKKDGNKIELDSTTGIIMKYPTFEIFEKLKGVNASDMSKFLDLLVDLLDYAYDSNQIYKEFTKEEAQDFFNKLTNEQFLRIGEYIKNIPTIEINIPFKCKKCGHEEMVNVKGLTSFFV